MGPKLKMVKVLHTKHFARYEICRWKHLCAFLDFLVGFVGSGDKDFLVDFLARLLHLMGWIALSTFLTS
jgi:hypothetical protein